MKILHQNPLNYLTGFFLQCNISRNLSLPYTKFQSKQNLTSMSPTLQCLFPPAAEYLHPTL